jgi:sterol desaturase/sphingolipid hydroxylase (fatty acid hydroxylase superfamily)
MESLFQQLHEQGRLISIGFLLFLLAWESFIPFFSFFRKQGGNRARHAIRNLLLGAGNALLVAYLFVSAWFWAAEWAQANRFGILEWSEMPTWVEAAAAVLLFDFWTYWWHRMNHRIPFLWRFHRLHHSDPYMDVTTASRFHLGEIFMSSALRIPFIILIGADLWHLALYETIMFSIVQLHHANIGLPPALDRFLRSVIVTPAMHKVHHSRRQRETDSNYTSLLSVWDRLFRSFRLRDELHDIRFGLENYDDRDKQTIFGMLKTPIER